MLFLMLVNLIGYYKYYKIYYILILLLLCVIFSYKATNLVLTCKTKIVWIISNKGIRKL